MRMVTVSSTALVLGFGEFRWVLSAAVAPFLHYYCGIGPLMRGAIRNLDVLSLACR
jgi:hypothetical protein